MARAVDARTSSGGTGACPWARSGEDERDGADVQELERRPRRPRDADATSRWAALGVPSACLASEFTPTAVIPGLELHELDGETAFYLSKEAKTTDLARTATELEEERAVKEELKEAKTEMKDGRRRRSRARSRRRKRS